MKSLFCLYVSSIGRFRRVKTSESNGFVVDFNFSYPFRTGFSNACKTAFVSRVFRAVLSVFSIGGFAKVAQPVVRAIPVYMIQLVRRPLTVNVQPRQPMRRVQSVVQSEYLISVLKQAACFVAQPAFFTGDRPSKNASFWIIADELKKSLLSDKVFFHASNNIIKANGMQA